jgi:D-alanyl-D-alanine carboxypeptidase (penicillin-binding protein 5/6)
MIPSADNVADLLAIWDAGSIPAFVARMNATAHALGMSATHYADASGVNPGSRSNALDQTLLAARLMANPVIRGIVSHPSLPFPVAGTITNYNPALGVDGIVGVKSGFTSQAQACLVTAAWRVVGGTRALVIVASTGQPNGLYGAARADEQLLGATTPVLVRVPLTAPGQSVARLSVPWSSNHLSARAPAAAQAILGWPGLVLHERVSPVRVGPIAHASARRRSAVPPPIVGTLLVSGPQGPVRQVMLRASRTLPTIPAGWTPPAR